jgi:hypothetical protein
MRSVSRIKGRGGRIPYNINVAKSITYALRSMRGEFRQFVITEELFNDVRAANTGLITVLGLEEKFDFILANYTEYEGELLRIALDKMVWGERDWSTYRQAKHTVNRRIVNLLSTSRLYIDQVHHDVTGISGPDAVASVRAAASAEYDSRLEYRVMEALRNHVQHRDVPVHELTLPLLIDADTDPITLRHSVAPLLDARRLAADTGFKASVLRELRERGDTVPLTPFIREYLASLSRVHAVVRRVTDGVVEEWEQHVNVGCDLARTLFGNDIANVSMIAEHPGEPTVRRYHFGEIASERRALRAKNRQLEKLGVSYVASEPPVVKKWPEPTG